jgi:hypothetical protein
MRRRNAERTSIRQDYAQLETNNVFFEQISARRPKGEACTMVGPAILNCIDSKRLKARI